MDKQKLEMARIIAIHTCPSGSRGIHNKWIKEGGALCYHRNNFSECVPITDAVDDLINAGYGDVKAAVREFAERLRLKAFVGFVDVAKLDELLKEYEV